ncbi:hypothetical protein CR513_10023, partial [Mucuna pruriens]
MNIPTAPSKSMGTRSSYSMKLSKPSLFQLRLHLDRSRTNFGLAKLLITSQSWKTMINFNLRGQRSFGIVLGAGHVQKTHFFHPTPHLLTLAMLQAKKKVLLIMTACAFEGAEGEASQGLVVPAAGDVKCTYKPKTLERLREYFPKRERCHSRSSFDICRSLICLGCEESNFHILLEYLNPGMNSADSVLSELKKTNLDNLGPSRESRPRRAVLARLTPPWTDRLCSPTAQWCGPIV